MLELAAQVESAATFLNNHWSQRPLVGLVLGTGLGGFAANVVASATLPYRDLPHFADTTALGHDGVLVLGQVSGVPVVVMQGRLHLYEGYSAKVATFPIRVMKRLGVELLIVSNACGGLRPDLATGDVMILTDQINLTWRNPLHGLNDDELGPRFPDMSSPFDRELSEMAVAVARKDGFPCHHGVYAGLTGPTYETRAEYRMLRRLGADVVGMSTVHEVIVGVHAGMKVLGISAVTNLCRPDTLESTSGERVKAAAERAEPRMRTIVESVVARYTSTQP